MSDRPLLWFRTEHKPHERRSVLTPALAVALREAGYPVVVEESVERAFGIDEYRAVGCRIEPAGSWRTAPPEAIVIGLKELDAALGPFAHRHVHFAHVYKYQQGWQALLEQFHRGGGRLYDLEYLTDEHGRRVAAFGYWAGYVGAALAVLAWCGQQAGRVPSLDELQAWPSRDALHATLGDALDSALPKAGGRLPCATVIGALGRSGRGAVQCLETCGIDVLGWDQAETAAGGPFDTLLSRELFVNCVFVAEPVPPFTTRQHLADPARRLSVIADVSCDPYGDANPLPIYDRCTDMRAPVLSVLPAADQDGAAGNGSGTGNARTPPLDLIAIDHLPSLLPRESSEDFAASLTATLLAIDRLDAGPWARAGEWFDKRLAEALST